MTREGELGKVGLDRIVHERARLLILTRLASSMSAEMGFTELRDGLGLTAGNLSVQLRTLEEAGYVTIAKSFRDNKPFTGVSITQEGKKALEDYLGELEVIVATLRGGKETT